MRSMSRLRRRVASDHGFFISCCILSWREILSKSEFACLAQVILQRRLKHGFLLSVPQSNFSRRKMTLLRRWAYWVYRSHLSVIIGIAPHTFGLNDNASRVCRAGLAHEILGIKVVEVGGGSIMKTTLIRAERSHR